MALILMILAVLIGGALVLGLAWVLRAFSLFRTIPYPWVLVLVHTLFIVLIVVTFPVDRFTSPPPFDDLYSAFFFIPGFHIYVLGLKASFHLLPWLERAFGHQTTGIASFLYIPSFVGSILGGLQWYWLGRLIQRLGLMRWSEPPAAGAARSRSP